MKAGQRNDIPFGKCFDENGWEKALISEGDVLLLSPTHVGAGRTSDAGLGVVSIERQGPRWRDESTAVMPE